MSNSDNVYKPSNVGKIRKTKINRRSMGALDDVPKFFLNMQRFRRNLENKGFFSYLNKYTACSNDDASEINELMIVRKNNSNIMTICHVHIPKNHGKKFSKQLKKIEHKLNIAVSYSKLYCNCAGVEAIGLFEMNRKNYHNDKFDAKCEYCKDFRQFTENNSIVRQSIDAYSGLVYETESIIKRWPGRVRWESR